MMATAPQFPIDGMGRMKYVWRFGDAVRRSMEHRRDAIQSERPNGFSNS
jgi:hypothetical protein